MFLPRFVADCVALLALPNIYHTWILRVSQSSDGTTWRNKFSIDGCLLSSVAMHLVTSSFLLLVEMPLLLVVNGVNGSLLSLLRIGPSLLFSRIWLADSRPGTEHHSARLAEKGHESVKAFAPKTWRKARSP